MIMWLKLLNLELVIVFLIRFYTLKIKYDSFDEKLKKHFFFDQIPSNVDIEDDVFLIFGKTSVVCCETTLYQFDYRKFIFHDKMYDECLAYEIECNCLYLLEKKLSCFNALCSNCWYNLIKMVSNRFLK